MGKSKQAKEKKFDRNVEISAPILDPEIIKAIHTPPKGQRIDIKHGGFKALLSDLNSQDSTDELMPLNDNHVPSYIGISCAVSGYSNYSSYNKRSSSPTAAQRSSLRTSNSNKQTSSPLNRSRTTSPVAREHRPEVHHITINKENMHSVDEERRELTEKLTASATDRRRSPSPITPTEDDRHHGTYVGARYCPLPPPSKLVNKHIPLLGIDDDKNPDEIVEDEQHGVEQKIASLYGENFVEDWRESMTHKVKKDQLPPEEQQDQPQQALKSPKDLVILKPPTESNTKRLSDEQQVMADIIPPPNAKVLESVEKEFLNKLLTDENPPMPSQSPIHIAREERKLTSPTKSIISPPQSPFSVKSESADDSINEDVQQQQQIVDIVPEEIATTYQPQVSSTDMLTFDSPSPTLDHQSISPEPMKKQEPSTLEASQEGITQPSSPIGKEEHIEYEIRAQSPLDNQSSPVRVLDHADDSLNDGSQLSEDLKQSIEAVGEQKLVSFSPSPEVGEQQQLQQSQASDPEDLEAFEEEVKNVEQDEAEERREEIKGEPRLEETSVNEEEALDEIRDQESNAEKSAGDNSSNSKGQYYLDLLEKEKSFISEQILKADRILSEQESELDEEIVGKIRSAIGKANLLINKKCNQFKQLCDGNINNNLENQQFAILNDDLAGFWDMLSIQIDDVRKSFTSLWQLEQNGWKL